MEQLGKCTKDSMLGWLTGQHKLPHGLSRKQEGHNSASGVAGAPSRSSPVVLSIDAVGVGRHSVHRCSGALLCCCLCLL